MTKTKEKEHVNEKGNIYNTRSILVWAYFLVFGTAGSGIGKNESLGRKGNRGSACPGFYVYSI